MTPKIGYTLSGEEHSPSALVRYARLAEEAGFDFLVASDHFHPWVERQGESPFVWGTLGGVAEATDRIEVGTGVTCPTMRTHPAVVAQAAATAAAMMPGRFFLGVGSGENLNEHIIGRHWPTREVRLEMLEEAIEVIRRLWEGERTTHHGRHFTVENARIYTLPDSPPPIMVAAAGPRATELAGRAGDGLVGLSPRRETIERFESAGGAGKPRYGQVHACWGSDEEAARRTALEWWPNGALPGKLFTEIALPEQFEQLSELVSEDDVAEAVVCGPDPDPLGSAVDEFVAAGFDHVYLHQVGPDQEGFLEFCDRELLPRLRATAAARA